MLHLSHLGVAGHFCDYLLSICNFLEVSLADVSLPPYFQISEKIPRESRANSERI